MDRKLAEFRMSVWVDSTLRRVLFEFTRPQRVGLPLAGPLGIDRISFWFLRRPRLEVESIPEADLLSFALFWFEVTFSWRSRQRKNAR